MEPISHQKCLRRCLMHIFDMWLILSLFFWLGIPFVLFFKLERVTKIYHYTELPVSGSLYILFWIGLPYIFMCLAGQVFLNADHKKWAWLYLFLGILAIPI